MDEGHPWEVIVKSNWRLRLLRKSIEFWPRSRSDIERLSGTKGNSFVLATYLLFSLFHMHVRAMTFGYSMTYSISEDLIAMYYMPSAYSLPTPSEN